MRYPHSKTESAELLRLVVPQLGARGSGCQPPSYTVWYEYVAGLNPDLSRAVDARLEEGRPLTEEETRELYGKYIAERDAAVMDDAHAELRRSLQALTHLASASGRDVQTFGDSLKDCGAKLEDSVDAKSLQAIVSSLAAETARMSRSNKELSEQLKNSERELQELSTQLLAVRSEVMLDPLTRLFNRRGLHHGIGRLTSERPEGLAGCSIVVADIDHFKRINDHFGHLFGDKVLRAVAQSFHACTKGRDIVARFGGEEFAIVLPDTHGPGALALAEQLRHRIASGRIRRQDREESSGSVTISLGVAEYDDGESFDDWLGRADQAMYLSKQSGRNRVTMAAPRA